MRLESRFRRCEGLICLISNASPALRPALIEAALEALTQSILDQRERNEITDVQYSRAIERLFPYLDGSQRSEALTLCLAITSIIFRAETLAELLPHCDGESRRKVIDSVVAAITSDSFGTQGRPYTDVMRVAAPFMRAEDERTILMSCFRKADTMSRSAFLSIVPTLCRVVRQSEGERGVDELYDSLTEVLSWYP